MPKSFLGKPVEDSFEVRILLPQVRGALNRSGLDFLLDESCYPDQDHRSQNCN